MKAASVSSLTPEVRDFLDVVAELLVRELLVRPEGDVARAPEPNGYLPAGCPQC